MLLLALGMHPSSNSNSQSNIPLTHTLALPSRPAPQPQQSQQHQPEQQQFIQPHAIYRNPPLQPPKTTPTYTPAFNTPAPPPAEAPSQAQREPTPATQEPSATTDDSGQPLKRKRGRPKGSKTKNRRIDGVLVPVESIAIASGSSATKASASTSGAQPSQPTQPSAPPPAAPAAQQQQHQFVDDDDDEDQLQPQEVDLDEPAAVDRDHSAVPAAPLPLSDLPDASDVTIHDFYDFQWRVMSLCSVFYESAGELVVSFLSLRTNSLTLKQTTLLFFLPVRSLALGIDMTSARQIPPC